MCVGLTMCFCLFVCLFVNGWMDFDKKNLFEHYGTRLRHGHHRLLKNGPEATEKWENVLKNA